LPIPDPAASASGAVDVEIRLVARLQCFFFLFFYSTTTTAPLLLAILILTHDLQATSKNVVAELISPSTMKLYEYSRVPGDNHSN
jgi:hypothetical protein